MPDDNIEEKQQPGYAASTRPKVIITIAAVVIFAVVVTVILALLGPTIGQIYSGNLVSI